jgi:hypothetical protein
MESPLDATIQPNVAAQIIALQGGSGAQQFLTGKPFGYASPSALDEAGQLRTWMARGKTSLGLLGFSDTMVTESPSAAWNRTLHHIAEYAPWLRSILVKHPLAYPADPDKAGTEPPTLLGKNATSPGVILLSDPVHALADSVTGDIDIKGTVAATLASAKTRRLFYVFLDHQMTAAPLERVLDLLAKEDSVAIVNLDQALRLCAADPGTRRCFDGMAGG